LKGNPYEMYVSLSEKCQWNCKYCDFPTFQDTAIDAKLDNLKKQVKIIKQFNTSDWNWCIEGGELGVIDEKILDYWFLESNVADTYHVATNGLFLDKYYEKYKHKIHTVLYHCLPDVKENSKIKTYDISPDILYYTVVITPENLKYCDKLFSEYQNLNWSIHVLQPRIPGIVKIDKKFYQDVINIISKYDNIPDVYIKRYQDIINDDNPEKFKQKRLLCANDYSKPMLDLVKNEINRCCITYTGDRVPFNHENFKKLLNNDVLFPLVEKDRCNQCIAGFIYDDNRNWIKNNFKRAIKIQKCISKGDSKLWL